MAYIIPCLDKSPRLGSDCFIAPNAAVIGDVIMGDECSVWFNAVVRGDVNYIKIGNRVNVQDGAVIHCTYQKNATEILPISVSNDDGNDDWYLAEKYRMTHPINEMIEPTDTILLYTISFPCVSTSDE